MILFSLIYIGFATVTAHVSSGNSADGFEAVPLSSKLAGYSLPRFNGSTEPLCSEEFEKDVLGQPESPTAIIQHILLNCKTKDVLIEARPINCDVEMQMAPILVDYFKNIHSIVIATAELRDDEYGLPASHLDSIRPEHPTLIYFCPVGGSEGDIELYNGKHSLSSIVDFVCKKSATLLKHVSKLPSVPQIDSTQMEKLLYSDSRLDVIVEFHNPAPGHALRRASLLQEIFFRDSTIYIAHADNSQEDMSHWQKGDGNTIYMSPAMSGSMARQFNGKKMTNSELVDFVLSSSQTLSKRRKNSILKTNLALLPGLSEKVWSLFQRNVPVVFIFHEGTEEEIHTDILKDKDNLKKLGWMYFNVKHQSYRSYAESLGLNCDVYPGAVGFTYDFESKFVYEGTFTTRNLLAWARDNLSILPRDLSKHVRSF